MRLIAAGVTPSSLEASPIVFGLLAESFSFTSADSPSMSTKLIVLGIGFFRFFSFLLISRSCFFIYPSYLRRSQVARGFPGLWFLLVWQLFLGLGLVSLKNLLVVVVCFPLGLFWFR